jgi:hypothetical protein
VKEQYFPSFTELSGKHSSSLDASFPKFDALKEHTQTTDIRAISSRRIKETAPVLKKYSQKELYERTKHVISANYHDLDKGAQRFYLANETDRISRALFEQISAEGESQLQKYAQIVDYVKEFEATAPDSFKTKRGKAEYLNAHQKKLSDYLLLYSYKYGHIKMAIEEYTSWKNHMINHYLRYSADHRRAEKNPALKDIPNYKDTIQTLTNNPSTAQEIRTFAKNIGKVFEFPDAKAVLPEDTVLKKDMLVAKILPFLSGSKKTKELSKQDEKKLWVDDAYNSTSIYLDHHYGPAFINSSDNNARPKTATIFIKADRGMPGFFAQKCSSNKEEGEVILPRKSPIQFEKIYDFNLDALSDRDRRILCMPDYVIIARYQKMPEPSRS